MKPLRTFGLWLDRWVDRIVCVLGAVAAAQGPSFLLQYTQRLGGHLEEARRQLAVLVSAAEKSGHSWREWAETARSSSDAAVAELGRVLQTTQVRADELERAHQALREAGLWERPFVFLRHVDVEVFSGTWSDYQPTVPTTAEGAVYALAGMSIALVVYRGLLAPLVALGVRRLTGRGAPRPPGVVSKKA
ncbi:DUF2937 family protein [Nibricoccus sp. IMCC34717]|uniref:DUF2937 family protein n=1 Tax=Nibricoccus sp. IMCC34717 TaxID=3034021 RepID=UPI003850C693